MTDTPEDRRDTREDELQRILSLLESRMIDALVDLAEVEPGLLGIEVVPLWKPRLRTAGALAKTHLHIATSNADDFMLQTHAAEQLLSASTWKLEVLHHWLGIAGKQGREVLQTIIRDTEQVREHDG